MTDRNGTYTTNRQESIEGCRALEAVQEGLVDLDAAREFLGGISRAFIYRLMSDGKIAWVQVSRRRMVPIRALREYAAARLCGGRVAE